MAHIDTQQAPLAGARFLKPADVMRLTDHHDRSAFWQWVRRAGLPFVKLSTRKYVFEESVVRAWLDRRRVGGVH